MNIDDIQPNSVWKHYNGRLYSVLTVTNMYSQNPDYIPQVVYQGFTNGHVWSRPVNDWFRSFTLMDTH